MEAILTPQAVFTTGIFFSQFVISKFAKSISLELQNAPKKGQKVAMFAFFKLSWIFRLKAMVVLNLKNVARQKQICVVSDYKFFVLWQLRLFFSLKVSSFAGLS